MLIRRGHQLYHHLGVISGNVVFFRRIVFEIVELRSGVLSLLFTNAIATLGDEVSLPRSNPYGVALFLPPVIDPVPRALRLLAKKNS